MSYYHFFHITSKIRDDVYFQDILNNFQLFSWSKDRYFEWCSRTFIELVMVIFAHADYIIWKIADILILLLLVYALSYMFSNDNLKGNTWFIVFLLLAYPIEHMASAGWIATTLNYLWPLTFGIISFIPIKKYLEHRKIQWFEYPIYLLSLLFAVSQEQMCAIILTFYFIFSAYTIILKRYNYFIFLLFFVSILNFFYIILSPGNSIRIVEEVQKWFIYFEDLSLLDRLLLGFNTTVSLLLNDIPGIFSFGISNQLDVHNNVNLVFLVFSILLVMLMFKKQIVSFIY